jgi:membrane-bound serine protease (ClpP class)
MPLLPLFFILLSVGIILICLEIFLPGGVIGAVGLVALLGAMVVAFPAFDNNNLAILIDIGIILLLGVSIVAWLKFFPKSRIGRALTLANDGKEFKASEEGLADLLGKEGESKSDLRPAGFAIFDGRRVDVVTEGGMIEKGKRIRVIEVEGNRVVVRVANQEGPASTS